MSSGKLSEDKYKLQEGAWFHKGRILISLESTLAWDLIHEHYSTPIAGYSGFERTLQRLGVSFSWQGLQKQVWTFFQNCEECQQCKYEITVPARLLAPLPILERIWEDIHMDFITGLPNGSGKTVIMIIVDQLSKYANFALLAHPYSAESVARAFVENVFKFHGLPRSIVSDRDLVFTSMSWGEVLKL